MIVSGLLDEQRIKKGDGGTWFTASLPLLSLRIFCGNIMESNLNSELSWNSREISQFIHECMPLAVQEDAHGSFGFVCARLGMRLIPAIHKRSFLSVKHLEREKRLRRRCLPRSIYVRVRMKLCLPGQLVWLLLLLAAWYKAGVAR